MSRARIALLAAVSAAALLAVTALAPDALPRRSERVRLQFSPDDTSVVVPPVPPESGAESTAFRWEGHGSTGDLVKFGENIHIPAGQRVRGDVVSVGGNVEVEGIVDGDAVALGGDVRIQGRGDVRGQAISLGGKVIHRGSAALRGSSVSMPAVPAWLFDFNVMNLIGQGIKVIQLLVFLGFVMLVGWAATLFVPDRTERAAEFARAHPGMAFLWGFGAIIAIAPSLVAVALVSALLCITLIGIPVAILLLVGYAAGLAVLVLWGYLIGAAVVGRWAALRYRPLDGDPTLRRLLLYGITVLFAPAILAAALKSLGLLVPVASGLGVALGIFGGLVACGVFLVGLGAALASRAGSVPRVVPVAMAPAPSGPPTSAVPPASSGPGLAGETPPAT